MLFKFKSFQYLFDVKGIIYIFKVLIVIALLFVNGKSYSQNNFNGSIISGRLLDSITYKPIADVVVVNKKTNKVTLSGHDGYYYINVNLNDTLVFYLIGYFPKFFLIKNQQDFNKQVHVSFLKPNIEELKVTAKKITKEKKKPFNQTPATIESPISFLYEQFSRKYKQYRKIEALEKEKYDRQLKDGRFTKEFVMSVTGIEEDVEAEEFMRMCRFSNDFLENASDYDFLVAIHKKYRYYSEKR